MDPWGLRPATDADLAAYQQANQGALAKAKDWASDNWEYLAAGAMVVGGGLLMATGVGGPVGMMLVSGGISMGMQKASTGSVDPAQLAMDMIPGGPLVQGLAGGASAAYSYMKQPGPHNVAGLLGDVAVGSAAGALPGPSGAGRKVAGGVVAAGAQHSGPKFTRAAETQLADISPTPTAEQKRQLQETLRWTPEQVQAAKYDRPGVERYLNDSVMFSGPTDALRGSGKVWEDPLGNTVRVMDGERNPALRFNERERIVFNGLAPSDAPRAKAPQLDPLTWKQAQPNPTLITKQEKRTDINNKTHIFFED